MCMCACVCVCKTRNHLRIKGDMLRHRPPPVHTPSTPSPPTVRALSTPFPLSLHHLSLPTPWSHPVSVRVAVCVCACVRVSVLLGAQCCWWCVHGGVWCGGYTVSVLWFCVYGVWVCERWCCVCVSARNAHV